MNILIKIKSLFKKDELFGQWHTDDGSGFMIIMWSRIDFKKNGSGSYESWSSGDEDEAYHYKGNFQWTRIEKNKISIKEIDSEKVELIEYSINNINGRQELSSKQQQMGNTTTEAFWDFEQVLFKTK